MAAQFNADGTIKGYSALTTKVDGIEGTVTSNKTAADNAFANVNRQLGSLEDYIEDVDEEQEESATWIQQNKNKWSAVAASFDDNGYVTAAGKVGVYVANQLSYFEVDADKINFNVGFEWNVYNGDDLIFKLDNNGNLFVSGSIDTKLSYNNIKFLSESYTINLSRDHYNIYCLSGGSIDNTQEITLPSARSCVSLELTFFCEFRAHTRSWTNPVLKGDFYIPTSSSYGNTGTEMTVETFKVYRLLSVGNFWAIL